MCAAIGSGCGSVPQAIDERGLYLDLRKTVELREQDDWVADRLEIQEAAPGVMRSVCQVDAGSREHLDAWLEARIREEDGPAAEAFRRDGDIDSELLRLERVRALLAHTHQLAESDCPFWLSPDLEFAGVQGDESRFVLLGESMGAGALVVRGSDASLGGIATGRLFGGYGIANRLTLAIGGELGGAGALPEDETGTRSLEAAFTAGIPVLLRISNASRIVDFELAATTRWSTRSVRWPPGARASIGYGISTMRVGGFMPYALLWLGYQINPPRDTSRTEHVVMLGTRFGFNWDP